MKQIRPKKTLDTVLHLGLLKSVKVKHKKKQNRWQNAEYRYASPNISPDTLKILENTIQTAAEDVLESEVINPSGDKNEESANDDNNIEVVIPVDSNDEIAATATDSDTVLPLVVSDDTSPVIPTSSSTTIPTLVSSPIKVRVRPLSSYNAIREGNRVILPTSNSIRRPVSSNGYIKNSEAIPTPHFEVGMFTGSYALMQQAKLKNTKQEATKAKTTDPSPIDVVYAKYDSVIDNNSKIPNKDILENVSKDDNKVGHEKIEITSPMHLSSSKSHPDRLSSMGRARRTRIPDPRSKTSPNLSRAARMGARG